MAELEKEVRELKQKLGQSPSPANVETEGTDDLQNKIDKLSDFLEACKRFELESEQTKRVEVELEEAKKKIMNRSLCGRKLFGWDKSWRKNVNNLSWDVKRLTIWANQWKNRKN